MDFRSMRNGLFGVAILATSLGIVGVPTAVQAQDVASSADSLSEERLTQYATLHLAIAEVRDEFHQAKARVHDAEARERLREQTDERLHALYEEHGMPKEEYDGITFMVSIDNDLRARLEEVLASLNATDN